jgi:sugar phosphate isomerase/epimerase
MSSPTLPDLFFAAGTILSHHVLERAEAVAAGGFSATSCFVGDLVGWEAGGRSLAELRRELDARGAPVDTILPILSWHPRWDPANPTGIAAKHGGPHVVATQDDALRWAQELGAQTVTLAGPWGGPDAPLEELVDGLGRFCDRAAVCGTRLQLELVPSSKLPDVSTLLALMDGVGRPNLGLLLDTYNLGRAAVRLEELDLIPLDRIFALELADAAASAHGEDYFDDALHHRLPAGEGDLEVAGMVRRLAARGPLPPCGFEVMSDAYATRPAAEVGAEAGTSVRRFLGEVLTSSVS